MTEYKNFSIPLESGQGGYIYSQVSITDAIYSRIAYFNQQADQRKYINKHDKNTGSLIWQTLLLNSSGQNISSNFEHSTFGEYIYVWDNERATYQYNQSDGSFNLLISPDAFASNTTNYIYYHTTGVYALVPNNRDLEKYNHSDGSQAWSITLPEDVSSSVFFGDDNSIYCYTVSSNRIFKVNLSNGSILWDVSRPHSKCL